MQPIHLLDLASRKSAWLAARQATIAGNVANADTPGFRAKDVAPFADVMAKTQLQMASTDAGHLPLLGLGAGGGSAIDPQDAGFEVTSSGNSVGIEQEMIKAGDVNRDFAMTTNVVKSFHNMLMAALRE